MTTIKKDIDISKGPTKEQIKSLEQAMEFADKNNDEGFSKEELKQFYRIKDKNKIERQKQIVTIRLSPKAANKAHSLGKGYTSVLSRILEAALDDPNIIKHFL